MKRLLISVTLAPALLLFSLSFASDTQPEESKNPLVDEMLTLNRAFKEIVSAVALGDSKTVLRELGTLHGKMEKTEEGFRSGRVRLPRNQDKLDKFELLDKEFHRNLNALEAASNKNNGKDMLRLTKALLDGCVRCHRTFK